MKRHQVIFLLILFMVMIASAGCSDNPQFFAGRFTEEGSANGMFLCSMNGSSGEISKISEFNTGPNPSFFCFNRDAGMIYTVNEVMQYKGEQGGGLSTFRYLPGHDTIIPVSDMRIPFGGPCHISLTPANDYLLIANYQNASVVVVKLDAGMIPVTITDTVIYEFRSYPVSHAHMVRYDPQGQYVYVADLGWDRVLTYDLNRETGKLNLISNGEVKLPEHSGPRHFVFNSDGSKMYLINELGSTLSVLGRKGSGELELLQTQTTLPPDYAENNYCAEIRISKDGKFIYGSNRGHNSIVIFRVGSDGLLTLAGHVACGGDWPRYFTIDPSGKFLLAGNQKSGDISVFKINRRTGMLKGPVKQFKMPDVACIVFW